MLVLIVLILSATAEFILVALAKYSSTLPTAKSAAVLIVVTAVFANVTTLVPAAIAELAELVALVADPAALEA